MLSDKTQTKLDNMGQALSFACLIHCLLLPVLISTIPFLGFFSILHTPAAEWSLMIFAAANAVIAVTSGFKTHKNYLVLTVFLCGMLFFAANFLFSGTSGAHEHIFPWIPLGAFVLGVGHILNRKSCASCPKCKKHE